MAHVKEAAMAIAGSTPVLIGFGEAVPIGLITLVIAAPAVAFVAAGHGDLGLLVAIAAAISLGGMVAVHLLRTTTLLWLAVGVNVLGALGMIWWFGGTFLLGALLMILYGFATARRLGFPVITWRGVLGECLGFGGALALLGLIDFS
jgi:hypothetical protein